MEKSGIKTIHTEAVIDKTHRAYPGTRLIKSADALLALIHDAGGKPLFAKCNTGLAGFGVFMIEGADNRYIHLHGRDPIIIDEFWDQHIGDTTYIIESLEKNHSFFDTYTTQLATIRLFILSHKDKITIPFAVQKNPANDQITDHFWHKGNYSGNISVEDGTILTMHEKGTFEVAPCPHLTEGPDAIVDQRLPFWTELITQAKETAPIFSPLAYQSADIAITEDGPRVVEWNIGGGFELYQNTSKLDFLTPEVKEFFLSNGYYPQS